MMNFYRHHPGWLPFPGIGRYDPTEGRYFQSSPAVLIGGSILYNDFIIGF